MSLGFMCLLSSISVSKGMIFNSNDWKVTRKFSLHAMRDFGLGKSSLEEKIQEEASALVEHFKAKANQAFDPKDDMVMTVSNIICSIVFGKR